MKKLLKIIGSLIAVALVLVLGAVVYVTQFLPNIPVQATMKVEATPERIARGQYLAHHVCVCMDCHSSRD